MFLFVDTKEKNPEAIVIDNDDCNNNDENDVGGCKGNPKTKHKENRYTGISNILLIVFANFLLRPNIHWRFITVYISNTFSIVFDNFLLRPNIYWGSIAVYFAYLLQIFQTKVKYSST